MMLQWYSAGSRPWAQRLAVGVASWAMLGSALAASTDRSTATPPPAAVVQSVAQQVGVPLSNAQVALIVHDFTDAQRLLHDALRTASPDEAVQLRPLTQVSLAQYTADALAHDRQVHAAHPDAAVALVDSADARHWAERIEARRHAAEAASPRRRPTEASRTAP